MKSSQKKCSVCGNTSYINFYELKPYLLVQCSLCGLIRVSPMPDEQERVRINQMIYSIIEYRERYFKDKKFIKTWFKNKLKIIEKLKPQKGKILDIGCSYGFFLEVAKESGWEVYGIETNPVIGDYLKNRFGNRVFVGKLEEASFPEHMFNVVTLWDVIEHMVEPVNFLKIIKEYLQPEGIIGIQVPHIGSYIAKLKNKDWDWLTPGDHLYFFTPETLQKTIKSAGLKPVYLKTWEPDCYFIDSVAGFKEINNWLFELYRNTVVRVFRKLLFFVFIPFQWIIRMKEKGALIVMFTVIDNKKT